MEPEQVEVGKEYKSKSGKTFLVKSVNTDKASHMYGHVHYAVNGKTHAMCGDIELPYGDCSWGFGKSLKE